jgi:riboflavin kinase/FMN adenylyltransferase
MLGGRIAMIQTLEQRLAGIRAAGVQAVLVLSFDRTFASLTPAEFVRRMVVTYLKAKEVVVGENFRFGRSRRGDVDDLRRLGRKLGFAVSPIPSTVRKGRIVSSSLIRRFLDDGRIGQANTLLGHPYEIQGRVIRGSGRGRELGFPTANVRTANEILPRGVFLTSAHVLGRSLPSLTNIGTQPTFGGRLGVETHVFGWEGELYGRRISLGFIRRLRAEKRFASPQDLVRRVKKDIEIARGYFERRVPSSRAVRRRERLTFPLIKALSRGCIPQEISNGSQDQSPSYGRGKIKRPYPDDDGDPGAQPQPQESGDCRHQDAGHLYREAHL